MPHGDSLSYGEPASLNQMKLKAKPESELFPTNSSTLVMTSTLL